jgi:hypothetical protein
MSRRLWIAVVVALISLIGLGVGIGLALSTGSNPNPSGAPASSGVVGTDWEKLYGDAHVGQQEAQVLARWPKVPYQHYHDNLLEDCYEWQGDKLYNLCFKNGVLRLKTNF